MAIITLTSDLGLKDYYVASLKGAILSQTPNVKIVDITHEVPSFNFSKAAFIIKNCYFKWFKIDYYYKLNLNVIIFVCKIFY